MVWLFHLAFLGLLVGAKNKKMNISVTTNNVEFHDMKQLVKFKAAGTEVEVLVFISSLCILTTNISIAKYVNYIYGH